VHGTDPPPCPPPQICQAFPIAIGNPRAPFKTIQAAIDYAHKYLVDRYASTPSDLQAIVRLMPGLYFTSSPGVSATAGNGEKFPITMRDRVHVIGTSARTCVLRAAPASSPDFSSSTMDVFWPTVNAINQLSVGSMAGVFFAKQVLVRYDHSSRFNRDTTGEPSNPWCCDDVPETAELVANVTFQGADVQIYFGFDPEQTVPTAGRVANCLFDMRDGYPLDGGTSPVSGPTFGLLMAKSWVDEDAPLFPSGPGFFATVVGSGYMDQFVHVANNSFIMNEFFQGSSGGLWAFPAKVPAVAIADASYPLPAPGGDPDKVFRGVGHPGIQNNVFRTFTGDIVAPEWLHAATIGIAASDTTVADASGAFVDPNAYCVERVGSNCTVGSALANMKSVPIEPVPSGSVVYHCGSINFVEGLWNGPSNAPAAAPNAPIVPIWDGQTNLGSSQFDPAFIGEYLRTVAPALPSQRDWRLIPGSPLEDKGVWTLANQFAHGVPYPESPCDPLKLRTWDGEGHGNPRIVDGKMDLGFDETHLCVIAGSYANHSFSHNQSSFLNPYAENEQATRFILLPEFAAGGTQLLDGRTLSFITNEKPATPPPPKPPAWTQPPESLPNPVPQPNSLPGYDLVYTTDANPLSPYGTLSYVLTAGQFTTWPNWQQAPGNPPLKYYLIPLPADNEGSTVSWVNLQPKVTNESPFQTLFGPLQAEFR
jgi:hypothetical protein